MIENLGQRQQLLLETLLEHRTGMSAADLATQIGVSRNATLQHLAVLEKSGLIDSEIGASSGGRPARRYRLSSEGHEQFQRHYPVIARLLLDWIHQHHGKEGLDQCLASLGSVLAREYQPRMDQLPGIGQKIEELAVIMRELGYHSSTETNDDGASEIVAKNCVFDRLARDCEPVCRFDLQMMGDLLDARVELTDCIARNGQCCRFAILP